MLSTFLRQTVIKIENSVRILLGNPPPASCLALVGLPNHQPRPRWPELKDIFDPFVFMAVQRNRRSIEKRLCRKHSPIRILVPKKTIRACDVCGHYYEVHTICGNCYDAVRKETAEMKEAIQKAQPKGPIEKEIVVLYEGEETHKLDNEDLNMVEMPKQRPPWFSKNLLSQVVTKNSNIGTIMESDVVQISKPSTD